LGDVRADGRTIWIGFMQGSEAGSCEHYNGPSGSIQSGEFLDQLSDYYLFNGGFIRF
jgi:hypothetical protein